MPRIATADGTRLHVEVRGGTGPSVVLLHAWGLSSRMWDVQVMALLDAGFRVVTVDRRGHGRSDVAVDGYDLDTLVADLETVVDEVCPGPVAVVGHSMGGTEAVALAARLGDRLTALVASAPAAPALTASADNPLGLPADVHAASRRAMRADLGAWIVANTAGYWGTVEDDRWRTATCWTQQALHDTPLPVLLACAETMAAADLRADAARIEAPALVVQGDADLSMPLGLTGEPLSRLLPFGELVVVPDAGHGLYASFAAVYDQVLVGFLDRHLDRHLAGRQLATTHSASVAK